MVECYEMEHHCDHGCCGKGGFEVVLRQLEAGLPVHVLSSAAMTYRIDNFGTTQKSW